MVDWKKEGDKKWKENFQYYITEKRNVVVVQPVMLFVRKKLSQWWRMKKALNIRKLMKANVFVATSASRCVQAKQQEHNKERYEHNIIYHGCWNR